MKKLSPEAERILQKAVQEYENDQFNALSDAPVEAHRFSSRFEKNIEKIKLKDRSRSFKSALRVTYRVSLGIAAVLLIICLVSPVKHLIYPYTPSEDWGTYWRGDDSDSFSSDADSAAGSASPDNAGNGSTAAACNPGNDNNRNPGGLKGTDDDGSADSEYNSNPGSVENSDSLGETGDTGNSDKDSPNGSAGGNAGSVGNTGLHDNVTGIGNSTGNKNGFEYLGDFDYVTEKKTGKSFKTDGFVNTEATSPESAEDVFSLAKKEYTGTFDFAQIYHDDENRMWKVSFVRDKQTIRQIYIRDNGVTVLIAK